MVGVGGQRVVVLRKHDEVVEVHGGVVVGVGDQKGERERLVRAQRPIERIGDRAGDGEGPDPVGGEARAAGRRVEEDDARRPVGGVGDELEVGVVDQRPGDQRAGGGVPDLAGEREKIESSRPFRIAYLRDTRPSRNSSRP